MYDPANRFSSTGEAALINGSRINQTRIVNRTHSASRQPRVIIIGAGMSRLAWASSCSKRAMTISASTRRPRASVAPGARTLPERRLRRPAHRYAYSFARRIRNGTGAMVGRGNPALFRALRAQVSPDALHQLQLQAARPLKMTKSLMRHAEAAVARINRELAQFVDRLKIPEAREAFAAFAQKRSPDFSKIPA